MVNALKKLGGNVKFTIYPKRGHGIFMVTYQNPELYEWFLKHSLEKSPDTLSRI
jgi:dipeptidyl aminopeptidase/acylaminoacyl peptidase